MNESPRLYTAVDLVEKVIRFAKMTPDPALWKEGLLKESPPRYVRLRQVNALARAVFTKRPADFLGKAKSLFITDRIPTVKSLLSGSFIKERNVRAYEEAVERMKATVREKEGNLGETGKLEQKHLIAVYQRLLKYRNLLDDVLRFNDDNPAADAVGLRFTVYVTDTVSEALDGKYAPLNDALAALIDPYGLSFTKEELQTTYNYPKEDLREVDRNFR